MALNPASKRHHGSQGTGSALETARTSPNRMGPVLLVPHCRVRLYRDNRQCQWRKLHGALADHRPERRRFQARRRLARPDTAYLRVRIPDLPRHQRAARGQPLHWSHHVCDPGSQSAAPGYRSRAYARRHLCRHYSCPLAAPARASHGTNLPAGRGAHPSPGPLAAGLLAPPKSRWELLLLPPTFLTFRNVTPEAVASTGITDPVGAAHDTIRQAGRALAHGRR